MRHRRAQPTAGEKKQEQQSQRQAKKNPKEQSQTQAKDPKRSERTAGMKNTEKLTSTMKPHTRPSDRVILDMYLNSANNM